jgi:hypothetical protein
VVGIYVVIIAGNVLDVEEAVIRDSLKHNYCLLIPVSGQDLVRVVYVIQKDEMKARLYSHSLKIAIGGFTLAQWNGDAEYQTLQMVYHLMTPNTRGSSGICNSTNNY